VELRWHGLAPVAGSAPPEANQQAAALETLRALLKRFGLGAGPCLE
jgi:hypothetical protein